MEQIIYKAHSSWGKVDEIKITSRTANFFTEVGRNRKEALETSYYKCFDTKEDAVNYVIKCMEKSILSAEATVAYRKENLEIFKTKYK